MSAPALFPKSRLAVTTELAGAALQLRVDALCPAGRTVRLRGKGVPAADGKPDGDHYIHLRVVLPDPPDPELRSFLEKWAKKHDYDVRRKAGFV